MAVHNIAVELAADHAAAQDESPMRLSHESPRFQARHQNVTKSVTNLVKCHQSCYPWNRITAGIRWKLPTCGDFCGLHGMQEVRGSSPLSSTRKPKGDKKLGASSADFTSIPLAASSPNVNESAYFDSGLTILETVCTRRATGLSR